MHTGKVCLVALVVVYGHVAFVATKALEESGERTTDLDSLDQELLNVGNTSSGDISQTSRTTPELTTAATKKTTVAARVTAGTTTSRATGPCDDTVCKPPSCTCISTAPPGDLAVKEMAQFVMLTFDDNINMANMPFYKRLLGGLKRKNKANGCSIAATFFASAEYLDYKLVHELYAGGNEIALHTISHKTSPKYWNDLDTAGWEREVVDERKMIEKFADVPAKDVNGFRAPFLLTGGDNGFRMLQRHLTFDSSLVHQRYPDEPPFFPYTLDYGFERACIVGPCPQDSYPGLWEVPLNVFFKDRVVDGKLMSMPCPMVDGCVPHPTSANETFDYLRSNFEAFYKVNRAPLPVFVHEAWLRDPAREEGYLRFVDWMLEKEDVFLVTVSEVLEFMRNPKPIGAYKQRHCKRSVPEATCMRSKNCEFLKTQFGSARYMRTCSTSCPKNYPWVNNPFGK